MGQWKKTRSCWIERFFKRYLIHRSLHWWYPWCAVFSQAHLRVFRSSICRVQVILKRCRTSYLRNWTGEVSPGSHMDWYNKLDTSKDWIFNWNWTIKYSWWWWRRNWKPVNFVPPSPLRSGVQVFV
jgi:hypothetical protein